MNFVNIYRGLGWAAIKSRSSMKLGVQLWNFVVYQFFCHPRCRATFWSFLAVPPNWNDECKFLNLNLDKKILYVAQHDEFSTDHHEQYCKWAGLLPCKAVRVAQLSRSFSSIANDNSCQMSSKPNILFFFNRAAQMPKWPGNGKFGKTHPLFVAMGKPQFSTVVFFLFWCFVKKSSNVFHCPVIWRVLSFVVCICSQCHVAFNVHAIYK